MSIDRPPIRVVFDANIFIQAALSGRGPAFACIELLVGQVIKVVMTDSILEEIEEVLARLGRKERYSKSLSTATINTFMNSVRAETIILPEPEERIRLSRDPDDEVYINLAIESGAVFLTSRDKDILDLASGTDVTAAVIRTLAPQLLILDPVEFLQLLAS